MLFELVRYGGSAVGAWALRRRIDRTGAKPYLFLSATLYALLSVYWLVFLRTGFGGFAGLLAAYVGMGFAGTCWMMGNLSYLPKLMKTEDHTLGLTLQGALAALAGGISVTLWGGALRPGDNEPGMDPGAFAALFFCAFAVCIVIGARLSRAAEPDAPAAEPLLPASLLLRPHRAVSYLITLIDPRR